MEKPAKDGTFYVQGGFPDGNVLGIWQTCSRPATTWQEVLWGMSWKSSGGNISRGVWMLRFRGANWAFMMHLYPSASTGLRVSDIPQTIQNLWLEWPVEQKHLVHLFNGYQWHNSVCLLLSHAFPCFPTFSFGSPFVTQTMPWHERGLPAKELTPPCSNPAFVAVHFFYLYIYIYLWHLKNFKAYNIDAQNIAASQMSARTKHIPADR